MDICIGIWLCTFMLCGTKTRRAVKNHGLCKAQSECEWTVVMSISCVTHLSYLAIIQ